MPSIARRAGVELLTTDASRTGASPVSSTTVDDSLRTTPDDSLRTCLSSSCCMTDPPVVKRTEIYKCKRRGSVSHSEIRGAWPQWRTPGAIATTDGAAELLLGGVPERQLGQGLVAVDIGCRAGAQLVLPCRHVAGAADLVRTPRGGRLLRVAGDERWLERPEVGLACDLRAIRNCSAPRLAEGARCRAIAIETRGVAGVQYAVVPAFDEAGVDCA